MKDFTEDEKKNENVEHEARLEDLQERDMEWLTSRAREIGIPNWKNLPRNELVKRLAESGSAPSH